MGAGDAPRSDVERLRWSADRLGAWTGADWGGGQSLGCRQARGDAFAPIVAGSARLWRASASARFWHRPVGTPFGPS